MSRTSLVAYRMPLWHLSLLVFAAGVAAWATSSRAATPSSSERRALVQAILDSLKASHHGQWAELGPLADGRSIRVYFEYLDDASGIRVNPSARDEQGRYCVTFDRRSVAIAAFAMDAAILCKRFGGCGRVGAYVGSQADAETLDGLKLFEEFEPSFTIDNAWKREPTYAKAWLDLYSSFVLMYQLHEIAHVALMHTPIDTSQQAIDRREAEADGFAAYVAARAGQVTFGAAMLVVRDHATNRGRARFSSCRAEALAVGFRSFHRRHAGGTAEPPGLPRQAPTSLYASGFNYHPETVGAAAGNCDNYAKAFFDGGRAAAQLFTPATRVESGLEAGQRCSGSR